MKKKLLILLISILTIIILAGVAIGTTVIVKSNVDIRKDANFYNALGDYFAEQEQPNKAIDMYEQSIALEENKNIRSNLAVLYHITSQYSKATPHLRILIEQEPSNLSYHYDLAVNLVDKFRETEDKQLEDLLEALNQYEQAEQLSPGYQNAKENAEVIREVLSEI